MKLILLASSILLCSVCVALAQVNTATVYGNVTDPAGASVPNARVDLKNTGTDAVLHTVSNAVGEFSFSAVPVGNYELSVQSQGFRPEIRSGLVFSAGQQLRLSVALQLGSLKDTVTVEAKTPLVNAVNAQQQQTINTQQVKELPTARLDWTSLLNVGTGVATTSAGEVAMNGLSPSAFSITVDGTNASTDPEYSTLSMPSNFNTVKIISPDAIQEISVTKGIAPAEIASTMSGNVNIISKGGTNQFHGDLFENNQVAAYNARNPLLARKTGDTFNQYGGSLGGPILWDRLFFFATYEGLRESAFQVLTGTVPTPYFISRAETANPAFANTLKYYPLPTQAYKPTDLTGVYQAPGSTVSSEDHGVLRGDYQITSTDLLTLRYTHSQPGQTIPRVIGVDTRTFTTAVNNGTATYTHSWASAVAVTRFGYNRTSLLRLDGMFNIPDYNWISIPGLTTGSGESFGLDGSNLDLEQTLAINKGRNSFKFGFIWQRARDGRDDHDIPTVSYANFNALLAGTPSQITINFGVNPFALHTFQLGGFAQDDFKVNRRLTLNVGVRYDYYSVPTESSGKLFNRTNYGFGPFLPPNAIYNPDWNNVAPRVGFAYTLDNSGATVVRGGFGIFTSPHSLFASAINVQQDAVNIPARAILTGSQALGVGVNYPVITSSVRNLIQNGLSFPYAGNSINPNFPDPMSMQYTLELQRQLSNNMVLSAAYVGNRGMQLIMVRNQNLPNRLTNVSPNPAFGTFRYIDDSNSTNYNSLQVSFKKRFSAGLNLDLNYTWSRSMGYGTSDVGLETPPQDNNNIRGDYGPTPFDVRHVFVGSVLYELPFARYFSNSVLKNIAGGWEVSSVVSAQTGSPLNIVQSSTYPSSRPDYIGLNPTLSNSSTTLLYLNSAAFALIPAPLGPTIRPGDIGRNALYAPGAWTVNLTAAKNFVFRDRIRFQLRGDSFNAFNHPNPTGTVTDLTSRNFGTFTGLGNRTLQLGARLSF